MTARPSSTRKPGEAVFAGVLLCLSLFLLWRAFGISGFEALSAPGSFPMAVAATMAVSAGVVLWRTIKSAPALGLRLGQDIAPPVVLFVTAAIIAYGVLLRPLGFLPTSALFLFLSIWLLWRRGPIRAALVALLSLACIYALFRLAFSVLMPEGIVPEREILAWLFG